jgi:hypothetical protein
MAIVVEEIVRRCTAGQNPSGDIFYNIYGTADEVAAREAMAAAAPTLYDVYSTGVILLLRESLSVDAVWINDTTGDGHWKGNVHYARVQTDDPIYTFDIGGGTTHIEYNLLTVERYAPPGKTAPNHNGIIGVTPDGVEGLDIPVGAYHFTETHFFADADVTPTYKGTLAELSHRTMNDASFKGFAAGECKLLGVRGGRRGSENWELEFAFAAVPNKTDFSVGAITGIDVLGWDHLDVEWEESVDPVAHAPVKIPKAAYVHRVNYFKDYGRLLIGI